MWLTAHVFTQVAQEAAEPELEFALARPTPVAVEVQQAYVYLFRVFTLHPSENNPLVLLPVAEPPDSGPDAAVADVDVQVAYVYLFLVIVHNPTVVPKANIPLVLLPAADP